MYDKVELEAAKTHAQDNEAEILTSKECGCFFCRSRFGARDIVDWDYDAGHTQAICPECGMASVIGDASGFPVTDKEFLKEMNLAFYGPDYISHNPDAARVYLDRYFGGKVNQNEKNENLALSYLKALVEVEDVRAGLSLASMYDNGGKFIKPNLAKAAEIYSLPYLRGNSRAQARLGALYLNGFKGPLDRFHAFESIMKSAVSGNFEGIFYLSVCYATGFFVDVDMDYSFHLVFDSFPEVYDAFLRNEDECLDFIDFAFRIATFFLEGKGVEKDEERAARYYLMTLLGIERKQQNNKDRTPDVLEQKTNEGIAAVAKTFGLRRGEIVYDQDTFYDTFSEGLIGNEKKRLLDCVYDPEAHTLEMTIEFPEPVIFIDEGNLNCEVRQGPVQWRFTDVARFQGNADSEFTNVFSPSEGVWVLTGPENGGAPVAFILFDMPEPEAK